MDDQNDGQNPKEKTTTRPSHIAYHVRESDEGKAFFNRVGSAFAHKDGKGFNVLLDSTPVNGKVSLRTVEDRIKAAKEGRRDNPQERNSGQSAKHDRGDDR